MKVVDFVVLGLATFLMIRGLFKGFLGQLFGVVGVVLVSAITANVYQIPAEWMTDLIQDDNTRMAVALIATGAILYLVYRLITMFITKQVTKSKTLGVLNRLIGMLLGALLVYCITAIIVSVLFNTDPSFMPLVKKVINPVFEGSWTLEKLFKNNFLGDWIVRMIVEKLQSALPSV